MRDRPGAPIFVDRLPSTVIGAGFCGALTTWSTASWEAVRALVEIGPPGSTRSPLLGSNLPNVVQWIDEDYVVRDWHPPVCRRGGCSAPVLNEATGLCQHHQAEQEMMRAEIAEHGRVVTMPDR